MFAVRQTSTSSEANRETEASEGRTQGNPVMISSAVMNLFSFYINFGKKKKIRAFTMPPFPKIP